MNLQKFYRICLEGNIGCGKSTLLCCLIDQFSNNLKGNLQNNPKLLNETDQVIINFDSNVSMIITPEPIKLWTNVPFSTNDGKIKKHDNLLEKMYNDPKRWAFTFEHYCQLTRFNQMTKIYNEIKEKHINETDNKIWIHLMERSIFSNRFGFVENFKQTEKITSFEYEILDEYFNHIRIQPQTIVDQFIYLRTDPTVVQKRIQKRSRNEENSIQIEYLIEIHKLHEKIFLHKPDDIWKRIHCSMEKNSAVICLNGNESFDIVYENFIGNIKNWINNIKFINDNKNDPKSAQKFCN